MAEERDLHMFYRLVNGIRSRQNNSNTNIYGIAAHTQQQQTHWIGTQKDPLSRDAGINSSDAFISRILQARQVRLDSPFSSNATASTTVPPTVLPVANPGSPLSSSRTEATPPCDGWSITGFEDSFCAADLGGDDETLATVHNSNNDGEEEEDAGVFDLDL